MTDLGIKGPEMIRLARAGIADIVAGSTTLVSGELPQNDGIDIAGLVQDIDTLRGVVDAYRPVLEKQYREKLGVVPLGFWPTGAQVAWCATPLTGLADMAGKKVRVFSTTTSAVIEAIGGTPVTMSFSEVVPAMQRGVIDCALTGANSGNTAKWTDVATHLYPLTVGWGVNFVVANAERWDGLDANVRSLLQEQIDTALEPAGWDMARGATEHGIWCSTGDARCNPEATAPKNLNKTNLQLVELSDADSATLKNMLSANVLPEFAKACGPECVAEWNEVVGPVVGVKIDASN
jgi:TRAP-type C4-dicarboxylate transport system substrate-binding protein